MADSETPPYEGTDPAVAEVNGLNNLIGQLGDVDALHDSGAIDDYEYAERRAKRLVYTAAIASWQGGTEPDVPALLEQMREKVAEPTQVETNAANIDFLLMTVGGDTDGE